MINFELRGRLGNQMFQYAMARKIQILNGNKDSLQFNFSKHIYSKNFSNELKCFNVIPYVESNKINVTFKQKMFIFIYRVFRKMIKIIAKEKYWVIRHQIELKLSNFFMKNGLYWIEDGYLPTKATKNKNKVLIGHFECSKNFNDIRDILLNEFEPIEDRLEKNIDLYKIIEDNNSVCISIRRGDFVENKEFKKQFYVCNEDYFEKAIKVIEKEVLNPVFIVFSDDINWVKENMRFPKNTYFEDGTDPVWEKLRLMKLCKHFIISNSTFSWWAQYLSNNKDKKVIAPSKWHNFGYSEEIMEDDWILIKK